MRQRATVVKHQVRRHERATALSRCPTRSTVLGAGATLSAVSECATMEVMGSAMSIAQAAFLLFLVMDPIGNIPLFLASLKSVSPPRQARVVVRELLIAYAVLLLFLFSGQPLLRLLGISEPALGIGGGVVLFLIAVRMIFPTAVEALREDVRGEPLVVPLAIPYVAGPSAIATVLLLSSREPDRWAEWWAALSLAWLLSAVILLAGSRLERRLGERGIIAVERLMGMLLVAIAVQMFLNALGHYVRSL